MLTARAAVGANLFMQTKDISKGLDRAIIRMVLVNPDIPSHKIMSALRSEDAPDTDRHHAQEIRRITRLVLDEIQPRDQATEKITMLSWSTRRRSPADVIGAAVKVMRIATGDEPDDREDAPALTPGQQLAKLGGAARAKSLTAEQRAEIARKGAAKRWDLSKRD